MRIRLGGALRNRSVTRVTGAAIGIAGLTFIGLGTAGVGTVTGGATATVTAPDCTTSPPDGACLHDGAGFEGVTATSFGSTCDFETQGTTTDGFHFILPASQGSSFVSLTAYFDVNGSLVTVTTTSFIQSGMGAIINEPNGAILLEATATITGGASGTASDGGSPFIVLSSTCAGTGATTTSSSSSTTTTSSPTTTTTSSPTTTTTSSPTTTTTSSPTTTTTSSPTTTTTTTTSGASGNLAITTTTTATTEAGGVLSTTTTPSTGADTEFGAGLALLMLGGGLVFGSTRLSRRKRQ